MDLQMYAMKHKESLNQSNFLMLGKNPKKNNITSYICSKACSA